MRDDNQKRFNMITKILYITATLVICNISEGSQKEYRAWVYLISTRRTIIEVEEGQKLSDCSAVTWGSSKDGRKISVVLTKFLVRYGLIKGIFRFECSKQFYKLANFYWGHTITVVGKLSLLGLNNRRRGIVQGWRRLRI
jgi:hypothetical protein